MSLIVADYIGLGSEGLEFDKKDLGFKSHIYNKYRIIM